MAIIASCLYSVAALVTLTGKNLPEGSTGSFSILVRPELFWIGKTFDKRNSQNFRDLIRKTPKTALLNISTPAHFTDVLLQLLTDSIFKFI